MPLACDRNINSQRLEQMRRPWSRDNDHVRRANLSQLIRDDTHDSVVVHVDFEHRGFLMQLYAQLARAFGKLYWVKLISSALNSLA
jgi:hypothetical protein